MKRGLRRFLMRGLCFALPLLAALGAVEAYFWAIGESWPARYAAWRQFGPQATERDANALYGRMYFSQQYQLYKTAAVEYRQPRIITVGSSRALEFRDVLFAPLQDQFYSAGGILRSVADLESLSAWRETLPKPGRRTALLVTLDPWWFRADWPNESIAGAEEVVYSPAAHISAVRRIFEPKLLRVVLAAGLRDQDAGMMSSSKRGAAGIGMRARFLRMGMRPDGSHDYGAERIRLFLKEPRYVDRERPSVIERVRGHRGQFSVPVDLDTERVRQLTEELGRLRDGGLEVIVLCPPLSDEVRAAFEADPQLQGWWAFWTDELPQAIRRAGFVCVSVPSPSSIGLDDRYMLDGYHPSEVLCGYLLAEVLDQVPPDSYLRQVDRQRLETLLKNAELPLCFRIPDSLRPTAVQLAGDTAARGK